VILEELVRVGSEVLPIYVGGSRLYLAVDDGGGYGRIYRYDLGSGDLDEVWSGEGARFSQAALDYINNRAVVVGLAEDSGGLPRSAVFVFNPSSEGVDVEVHPNTDEINMFRSVVYDHVYRRFIVGERGYGADASRVRSSWPNGGGLWVVPYEGLLDHSRWCRVYEFPGNPEVASVALHTDSYVYAALWRDGSVSKVVRSSLSSLVSWGDVFSARLNVKSSVHSEGNVLHISYIDIYGGFYVRWLVGTSWYYTVIGSVGDNVRYVAVEGVGKYVVVAVGKPGSSTSDIYVVNTAGGGWSVVGADVAGIVDGRRFLYDGRRSLYIGSVGGRVYRLLFDYGRVLTLTASPSVVRVGRTVTLTAVLRDEDGNPVSGATVDFYVAHSVGSSPAGHLIGSRTTDGTGTASITYTAPASPGRLMFFAVYRG
jgi:acyl-coenzyme A thioesterase PaaI-like protein